MRVRGALVAAVVTVAGLTVLPAHAATGLTVTPTVTIGTGLGFDAASAQRTALIRAWTTTSPYRSVNIYFAGTQRYDKTQTQLTADWVATVLANGWSLIPTDVDLQAPCATSSAKSRTTAATAVTDGTNAATQAIAALQALGLDKTVAYLDLEPFDVTTDSSCAATVIAYTDAWTQTLHNAQIKSGVYVNLNYGASTFFNAYPTDPNRPDDIWIARYDGKATATGYVPSGMWPGHQLHQYHGGTTETYAGVAINVDGDAIDGDVVSAASVVTPGGPPYTYAVSGTPAGTLNERSQPTSTSTQTGQLHEGDALNIECQAGGESITGDPVWDQLDNGSYVSDIYTTTTGGNAFSPAVPRCPSTDTTPPTVTLKTLPAGTTGTSVTISWSATDPANSDGTPNGILNTTGRVRWAPWNGGSFSSWHAVGTTSGNRLSWNVTAGYTYCFQVQSTDLAANRSAWSNQSCTMRALDDRSLTLHTGWVRKTDSRFYRQTYTMATSSGRILTRTQARTDRIGIVATQCTRCGSVRLYIGSAYAGTISLYASATHFQRVLVLRPFSLRSGTVTIKTTSSKLVQIDGVVISRG